MAGFAARGPSAYFVAKAAASRKSGLRTPGRARRPHPRPTKAEMWRSLWSRRGVFLATVAAGMALFIVAFGTRKVMCGPSSPGTPPHPSGQQQLDGGIWMGQTLVFAVATFHRDMPAKQNRGVISITAGLRAQCASLLMSLLGGWDGLGKRPHYQSTILFWFVCGPNRGESRF